MPSTHLSLHVHVVFSTKERRSFIADDWRQDLHAYLGGCVKTINGIPLAIGGVADHVHLLLGMRATHCLADVVRDIKKSSSRWICTLTRSSSTNATCGERFRDPSGVVQF